MIEDKVRISKEFFFDLSQVGGLVIMETVYRCRLLRGWTFFMITIAVRTLSILTLCGSANLVDNFPYSFKVRSELLANHFLDVGIGLKVEHGDDHYVEQHLRWHGAREKVARGPCIADVFEVLAVVVARWRKDIELDAPQVGEEGRPFMHRNLHLEIATFDQSKER
jgi:hypothetical protein